jgi:5-methylcytosine-specific restriction endonuclease McrA
MLQESMKNEVPDHASLADTELLAEVHRLAGNERHATAQLIAALGELDARRLYLGEGCSSLFTWCTQVLHLSEHAAYGRIEAARAAQKWPVILDMLADGSLHLTAVALLRRHLTVENHLELLAAARHRTKREVEEIIAALQPQPAVPSTVRKLPEPKTPSPVASPFLNPLMPEVPSSPPASAVHSGAFTPTAAGRTEVKPLAPERYKVQFTVSRETHQLLREAQDLLRHRLPSGDIGRIFERALTRLVEELRRTRHAAVDRPRAAQPASSRTRDVPAAVQRAVWARDGGRCAFVGAAGRCTERGFLEYHHVVPFADGGETTVENLELRCRAHNGYEAERWFGVREEDLVRETTVPFGVTWLSASTESLKSVAPGCPASFFESDPLACFARRTPAVDICDYLATRGSPPGGRKGAGVAE